MKYFHQFYYFFLLIVEDEFYEIKPLAFNHLQIFMIIADH